MASANKQTVLTKNGRVLRLLIPVWLAIGAGLTFLADAAFEKLFVVALLPWLGWVLFGLTILVIATRNAYQLWRLDHNRRALTTALALPVAAALLAFSAPLLAREGEHSICCAFPADSVLISEFQGHRGDYQRLLTMFREDGALGRVAYDFTRPATFFSGGRRVSSLPLTEARWRDYRRLFDRLSLTGGIEGYGTKRVICFWRYTRGMGAGLGGSSKGFAFSDSLPSDRPSATGCDTPTSDCWQFRPPLHEPINCHGT
jgi:hypothetical protein